MAHGSFPEVGQKQKTEERERKKERLNDGENNGQATHGARKAHASRLGQKREKDRMMVITMAKLRMAHASTHGARKPLDHKCKNINIRMSHFSNY